MSDSRGILGEVPVIDLFAVDILIVEVFRHEIT